MFSVVLNEMRHLTKQLKHKTLGFQAVFFINLQNCVTTVYHACYTLLHFVTFCYNLLQIYNSIRMKYPVCHL